MHWLAALRRLLLRRLGWCTFLVGLAVSLPARAERLKMEVGGANFRPYPIAAPPTRLLAGRGEAAQQTGRLVTTLLRDGLQMARSLALVPPSTYLADDKAGAAPQYKAWAAVGASGLVVSELKEGSSLQLHFYDVVTGKRVLQQRCGGAADGMRHCVHEFLDQIIEFLTGEPGIFSSRIAYVKRLGRHKQIFTCELDGANGRQQTLTPSLNLLPAWDHAGDYLWFTSFASGNADLLQLRLADGVVSPLSRSPGLNTGAAASPDGQHIALTLSHEGNTEIYVMDRDGSNLRRLTQSFGQDVSPSWSPDGRRIAFVSSRSGNPHLYVMQADGSDVRRLTFAGTYNQEPDWSPRADGQIAFTARDERLQFDLFLVHPETSVITRLTQDQGRNESPSHSPDGQHIVFVSTRAAGHQKELWIMDVDGAAPRRLDLTAGDYEAPAWGPRLGYQKMH